MSKANIIAGAHIKNFSEIIKPTKEEIEDKRKENKIISSKIKNCIFCNTKFNYGRSSRLSCGLCKIKYYCEYCGKEIIVPICKTNSRTQSNIYKLIQENNIKSYKSCCSTSHSRLLYNKNQSKPGVCRKCKEYSKIRNSFGLCPECTDRSKETICIKCGGESNKLDTTGRCPKCASKAGRGLCIKCRQEKDNLNAFGICIECVTGPGRCSTCGNFAINRNATGQCVKCINNSSYSYEKIISIIENSEFKNREDVQNLLYRVKSLKNYSEEHEQLVISKAKELKIPTNWREEFYQSLFSIISLESEDKIISFDEIDKLKGIPGVWARWTMDGVCLNVCQTRDIGKEMLLSIRKFNSLKTLKDYKKAYPDKIKSWWSVYKNELKDSKNNLIFKLVATNIKNKMEREKIEIQYAHDNKARYWNPAPGQTKHII